MLEAQHLPDQRLTQNHTSAMAAQANCENLTHCYSCSASVLAHRHFAQRQRMHGRALIDALSVPMGQVGLKLAKLLEGQLQEKRGLEPAVTLNIGNAPQLADIER